MEIESSNITLKGYITDLKSSNCQESASEPSDDSNCSDNGLFSIGRSGQRIINTKNILDENPTMHIESYKANAMSDEMKHNITAFISEQKQYFNQHGVDTISFDQQLSLTKASLGRKTGSIPEALDEIIHAIDPNNSMKYNSIVIRRFSDSRYLLGP